MRKVIRNLSAELRRLFNLRIELSATFFLGFSIELKFDKAAFINWLLRFLRRLVGAEQAREIIH